MPKVVITDRSLLYVEKEKERIAAAGCDFAVGECATEADVIAFAADADVLQVNLAPITAAVIEKLAAAKGIVRYGVGVDNVDLAAAGQRGIRVANVPHYCGLDVAEHAAALILSCLRKTALFDRQVKSEGYKDSRGWFRLRPMKRLHGTTVGIIGYGAIGRSLKTMLSGFGVRFLVYDPFLKKEAVEDTVTQAADLPQLIAESRIISLHLPLSEKTRGLIGTDQFARMREDVIFVNTSRGPVIDQDALTAFLKSHPRAVAGIDVWREEPPKPGEEAPFLPNMIATPHVGWYSEESVMDLEMQVVDATLAILAGKDPASLMNKESLRR